MTNPSVLIVGGGPTGLMLAGELALAGVDTTVVERRPDQALTGQRAGGLHARTIEILDQRGISERFLEAGRSSSSTSYGWIPVDIGDLPSRHACVLALWQNHIERILADWVHTLGVTVHYGREVTAVAQDDAGVDVDLSDGTSLRAAWLVGCDGGRSLIRKATGIAFPGWDPTISNLIAEVELTGDPEWGLRRDDRGLHALSRMEDGRMVRVMVTEQSTDQSANPTLQDLSRALIDVYGTDFGVHSPAWLSRFTDMTRQATNYRDQRILLAGDAAHVHYPVGGQGLNLGVQDAVNLGWKLAQVVRGTSAAELLDSYHAERHPVAARALRYTMAQVALLRTDDRTEALRDTMASLLALDEPRQRIAAQATGLDIHYDFGTGHPLLGRRMPDLDLTIDGRPRRLFTLLHDARPVLLDLGSTTSFDIAPWADRVAAHHATADGPWNLPALGVVPAPAAMLIRPDGYVAWVGDGNWQGLPDALAMWFGSPRA